MVGHPVFHPADGHVPVCLPADCPELGVLEGGAGEDREVMGGAALPLGVKAGGGDVTGVFHPQFRRLPVHQLREPFKVPAQPDGGGRGRVVAGGKEHPPDQEPQRYFRPRLDPEGGPFDLHLVPDGESLVELPFPQFEG